MYIQWFVLFLLLTGCASTKVEMLPVDYQYKDNPSAGTFELIWKNIYPYEVCFLREMWPDKSGLIVSAFDSVSVVVGNDKYVMKLVDGDYCPKCVTRVSSGDEIKAAIPYYWFGLPENLYPEDKKLYFSSKVFRCKGNL